MRKVLIVMLSALAALAFVQTAEAVPPPTQIFVGHGDIDCITQSPGPYEGQIWCGTGTSSADHVSASPGVGGVPIDLNVALPTTGSAPYPVVLDLHGYGQQKFDFTDPTMQRWLDKGYAVYTQSDRGFGYSCLSNAGDPGCANGYAHLADFRYEERDVQNLLGILADENIIQPTKIASTGNSYGAGMSMALAALKDRVMDLDGTLHPWTSPDGKPMKIAVSAPLSPWTDLNYALAPNGMDLDYLKDAVNMGPTGVMKESYIQALVQGARNAPIGSDQTADMLGWKAALDAGEPYDNPTFNAMKQEIATYHSSYGLPPVESPAPLYITSGFTDDVFPADEATRFYNRTRSLFPDSPIGLFFGSIGHPRGQVQAAVLGAQADVVNKWVDYYLQGIGSKPATDVTTYTQACPNGTDGAGPITAPDWASIAPGEIRVLGAPDTSTIDPDGGDFATAALFNPLQYVLSPDPAGTACAVASGSKEPGSANYDTAPAPAGGYTVMGATTVVAKVSAQNGLDSQIAARLVDISPDGQSEILVERGLWRPATSGFQVFQLHANGWKVEEGHTLRLELLPRDSGQAEPNGFINNYGRPSNDQQPVTVSDVDMRIPVLESPGALGGLVKAPAPRVLPDHPGVELAKGNEGIGSITMADYEKSLAAPLKAKIGKVKVSGPAKVRKGKKATYKVKITNTGNASATQVRLKVGGRGVSFNSSVGKIAAGKTRTLKVRIKPRKPGKVKLTFKVTSKNAGGKTVKKKVKVQKKH